MREEHDRDRVAPQRNLLHLAPVRVYEKCDLLEGVQRDGERKGDLKMTPVMAGQRCHIRQEEVSVLEVGKRGEIAYHADGEQSQTHGLANCWRARQQLRKDVVECN